MPFNVLNGVRCIFTQCQTTAATTSTTITTTITPSASPPSPLTQTIINKQVGGSSREFSSRVYRGRLIAYYSLFTAFVYEFFSFQPVYSLLEMIMIEIKRKQTCNRKQNIDLVNKWHYMRLENWKCFFSLHLPVIGCAVLHHHSHFQCDCYRRIWICGKRHTLFSDRIVYGFRSQMLSQI